MNPPKPSLANEWFFLPNHPWRISCPKWPLPAPTFFADPHLLPPGIRNLFITTNATGTLICFDPPRVFFHPRWQPLNKSFILRFVYFFRGENEYIYIISLFGIYLPNDINVMNVLLIYLIINEKTNQSTSPSPRPPPRLLAFFFAGGGRGEGGIITRGVVGFFFAGTNWV